MNTTGTSQRQTMSGRERCVSHRRATFGNPARYGGSTVKVKSSGGWCCCICSRSLGVMLPRTANTSCS